MGKLQGMGCPLVEAPQYWLSHGKLFDGEGALFRSRTYFRTGATVVFRG